MIYTDSKKYQNQLVKALINTLPKMIMLDESKGAFANLKCDYMQGPKKWRIAYWVRTSQRNVDLVYYVRAKSLFKAVWKMQKKIKGVGISETEAIFVS